MLNLYFLLISRPNKCLLTAPRKPTLLILRGDPINVRYCIVEQLRPGVGGGRVKSPCVIYFISLWS